MRTELYHYGVKGMRWGHRKARYSSESVGKSSKSGSSSSGSGKKKMSTAKKVAIGAAVVGGTMLVAYGGYKLSEKNYNKKINEYQKLFDTANASFTLANQMKSRGDSLRTKIKEESKKRESSQNVYDNFMKEHGEYFKQRKEARTDKNNYWYKQRENLAKDVDKHDRAMNDLAELRSGTDDAFRKYQQRGHNAYTSAQVKIREANNTTYAKIQDYRRKRKR